jgi:hypothetical protein
MNCALASGPMPPRTPSTFSFVAFMLQIWPQLDARTSHDLRGAA